MRLNDSQIRQMVMDLYPEIEMFNIGMSTKFNEEQDTWIITLGSDSGSLYTYMDSSYVSSCFNEHNCVYFTNQMMNVIDNYCSESGTCSI
ncbi:hypothetical protein [Desulfovibrio sp. JC022]|uniref:hypothetical protein n=1 Tax=Desulfovibrio sp. JC022 TaxID=2593642 RepID=UPI0013D7390B|nr:hypothetical protein [Desulfovibrio sp. JC022]NDV24175.1 hypothetical protein [Desulfovibrio sp. JC022]